MTSFHDLQEYWRYSHITIERILLLFFYKIASSKLKIDHYNVASTQKNTPDWCLWHKPGVCHLVKDSTKACRPMVSCTSSIKLSSFNIPDTNPSAGSAVMIDS